MLFLSCLCAHPNIISLEKRKKRDAGANQSDTSDGAQTDTTTGGETETSGASETAGGAAESAGVTGNTTACIPTSSAPDALLVSLKALSLLF